MIADIAATIGIWRRLGLSPRQIWGQIAGRARPGVGWDQVRDFMTGYALAEAEREPLKLAA